MSRNIAVCSACEQVCEATYTKNYPDNGWCLSFDNFGYRGGFSEEIGVLLGNRRSREWILCHDCVIRFFETFPLLPERIGLSGALHSCDNDTPCCKYAWREIKKAGGVRQMFISNNDGTQWIKGL